MAQAVCSYGPQSGECSLRVVEHRQPGVMFDGPHGNNVIGVNYFIDRNDFKAIGSKRSAGTSAKLIE